MSVKEIITKIKLFLNEEAEAEVSLVDVKTNDGTILSFEVLEPGKEIFVVDQAGRTPAPDAEYILEDGTKIVAEGGLIKEIEMPEAPEEEMPMEPVAEEEPLPVAQTLSVEDLAVKIQKLEDENLQIREILSQLATSFSEKNFKEEVKMSMVEKQPNMVEGKQKPLNKTNELNSIFKNMYKK